MNKIVKTVTGFCASIIVAASAFVYWQHHRLHPSTDDAYIKAHTVSIAPRISGQVSRVLVDNNQPIKKGQTLFTIDKKPFNIALQKAKASLDQTEQQVTALQKQVRSAKAELAERKAQLVISQQNYRRIATLVKKHSASLSDGDTYISKLHVAQAAYNAAQADLEQAQANLGQSGDRNAQIHQAQAAVEQAKLNLSYTNIVSPSNGFIANISLRAGDQVNAQQSYFTLIENERWWANANYKETDLSRIKPGQPASIHVDIYPHHVFHGHVDSLSYGSGSSFSLLPPENASGNWVKVTQRFPIRVIIEQKNTKQFPLRMGASCTVTIDTTRS